MPNSESIAASPKFRAVLEDVQIVSPVDCTILLRGETNEADEPNRFNKVNDVQC